MDLRIQKTKKNLKESFLQLLEQKDIEKITVKELCEHSMTSRNTFYTYYSDKYDLLEDCLNDCKKFLQEQYDALQRSNNKEKSFKKSCLNLLMVIMDLEEEFDRIILSYGSELTSMCYNFFIRDLEEFEKTAGNPLSSRYDIQQLNAFLICGFWGFVHGNHRLEKEAVRENALRLAEDLLESRLFNQ